MAGVLRGSGVAIAAGVDWRALVERALAFLRSSAARDRGRLGLWAPVALAAGAAIYLGLKAEPWPILAPLALAAAVIAVARLPRWRAALLAGVFLCLGFTIADFRASLVAAPVLTREIRFAEIEGRLLAIEESEKLRQLIIAVDRIDGAPARRDARAHSPFMAGKSVRGFAGPEGQTDG